MRAKLLILDLDMTLWDCPDISLATPPFRRIGEGVAVDAEGTVVRLRECVRELLLRAKSLSVKLAVASWNLREPAESALEALGIKELFDVVVIEPHPRKEEMVAEILEKLSLRPEDAVFIDDNPGMVGRVRRSHPGLTALRFGEDIASFCDLLEQLEPK
uniref:Magnesium-dependent phosphatase-1 n=1 Tax=Thermofilum pendens TaxID=2269 RepID=A0A7C3SLM2_THEPE